MHQLRIQLERQSPLYRPGETLRGKAEWRLDAPQRLEIRLFWFTAGGAVPESRVVEKTEIPTGGLNDSRAFSFRLPPAPYSFFGSLAMLGWAVELVASQANQSARATFQLSPSGVAVNLFWAGEETDENDEIQMTNNEKESE